MTTSTQHPPQLIDAVREEWRLAAETGATVALALIESPHYDERVLAALRWAINRSCDRLVRTGHRSYAVIFPHTEFTGAKIVIDRFKGVVDGLEPTAAASPLVSVGLAAFAAAGTNSLYLLIDEAQDALNQEKAPVARPKFVR